MINNNFIEGDQINVFVDGNIYSQETILKTLYWYGDKFRTSLFLGEKGYYQVSLIIISTALITADELDLYLHKFERDLIDFALREKISNETKNIRELLLAKAFSFGEFEELPPGDVSDPVGFQPILS